MVKIKQSPKLPAEERKMQLLMVAQELFAKKGYRDTTTDEIAKKAKLTKGAIYFHFKNKEEIFFELVKHVMQYFRNAVEENEAKLKKPGDFVKLFFDSKVMGGEHEEVVNNIDLWVQAIKIPRIKKLLFKSFEELRERFCAIYGKKVGRTKKDQRDFAFFTFSLIDGLMIRQIAGITELDINSQCKIINKIAEKQ